MASFDTSPFPLAQRFFPLPRRGASLAHVAAMRTRIFLALSFLAAAAACGDVATSAPGSTGGGGSATPIATPIATATGGAAGSTANAGPTPTTGTTTTAASGCSTSDQCQAAGGPGGHCQAPGIDDTNCGGPSDDVTSTCSADGDCADAGPAPQICVLDPCARILGSDDNAPVQRCESGCTSDDDCTVVGSENGTKAATTCQAGHCITPACSGNADCEPNFACNAGSCTRIGCTTDSDCSGFCVDGTCSTVPGACVPDAG